MRRSLSRWLLGLTLVLASLQSFSYAHEPIFGIGPRTIWKNGLGLEIEAERDQSHLENSWALHYEAIYGITENVAITFEAPHFLERNEGGLTQSGLGDVLLRGKWRFYRKDIPGGVYQASLLGGVEFPTGDSHSVPRLGSGSYDYLVGAAAAYEGRTWLLFGTARYRFNTENDEAVKDGNVFLYDLALGWRPVKTDYLRPDWVLMIEVNGQVFAPREIGGTRLTITKGSRLFGAVGLWLTYRNWAFKPGIQFPIYQNFDIGDFKSDYSAVFAVEVHF